MGSCMKRSTLSLIPPCRSLKYLCLLLAVFCCHCALAQGPKPPAPQATPANQAPELTLDIDVPSEAKEIVLTRPQNGLVPVQMIYSGALPAARKAQKTVQVSTSSFATGQDSVRVEVLPACDAKATKQSQPVSLPVPASRIVSFCLAIDPLPTTGKYTGKLILIPPAGKPVVRMISVSRPPEQSPVVVVSPQNVVLDVTRSFWPWRNRCTPLARLSVVVREKTNKIATKGVVARLESVTKSPASGFDLKNNARFFFNGVAVAGMQSSPGEKEDQRVIPAGQQAVVAMDLINLKAGEYNAVIRFSAADSTDDDAQKVTLILHVRDSMGWAFLWLIVAVSLSFVATKVLISQRRRLDLQQQVHSLRPAWFSQLPAVLAVVWVRAVLHQAQKLSSKFWLTSPELIESRVTDVRNTLKVLEEAARVRKNLAAEPDWLLQHAFLVALDGELSSLDAGPLDDAMVESKKARLKVFDNWPNYDKSPDALTQLWNDLKPRMQAVLNALDGAGATLPQADGTTLGDLKKAVSAAVKTSPTDGTQMRTFYTQYAKLKLLWDQRQDFSALEPTAKNGDIKKLFAEADLLEWERLKKDKDHLTIRMPVISDPDGFEAYDPLRFSVESHSSGESYMFRHKVEFHWTFKLTPKKILKGGTSAARQTPVTLKPEVLGPAVVQYFPIAGNVEAAVDLVYEGESLHVDGPKDGENPKALEIQASTDFGVLQGFEKVEVISWVIAAAVAIATGLSTLYLKGPTFGSYQDYLTLFLWGIGVDQGKNFLQALQTYSGSGTTPPSTVH